MTKNQIKNDSNHGSSEEIQNLSTKTFLTISEVSIYTGFSPNYLYQLVHNRVIPFYKPGRKLFFKQSEIDAWISSSRQKSIDEIKREATEGI